MELHLGVMTNAELAEFFEVDEAKLSKRKKSYLSKLENYCFFEKKRGGVEILHIYEKIYYNKEKKEYIEENFDKYWREDGDTVARVAEVLLAKKPKVLDMKKGTSVNYTRQARIKRWGYPSDYMKEEEDRKMPKGGEYGVSKYGYAKVYYTDRGEVVYEKFNKEDRKIFNEVKEECFPKVNVMDKLLMVADLKKNEGLSNEEATKMVEDITGINAVSYLDFVAEVAERLGCVRVQVITFCERK